MSVEISWYTPGHILHVKCPPVLSLSAMQQADTDLNALLDAGHPPIHVILDMLTTQDHPMSPLDLITGNTWLNHPHLGWAAHLTTNRVTKMLSNITIQIYVAHYKRFDDLPSVIEFLESIEP